MFKRTAFETSQRLHRKLTGRDVVPQGELLTSLTEVEASGAAAFGREQVTRERYAGVMFGVLGDIASLDIEPPLSEDQKNMFAGKAALYKSMLAEEISPEVAPTDTSAVATSQTKQ